MRNTSATSLAEKVSLSGTKTTADEKRSMITMIFLYPLQEVNGPRKSMAIESQGRKGISRIWASP
jgi:hypothetical protein